MNIKVTFQENNLDMTVKEKESLNGGFGGGTTDYRKLNNKPSINGVMLSGNKTAAQLMLAFQADIEDLEASKVGAQFVGTTLVLTTE